ncbi:MAG: 8-amino-7-oxononanoate synthase [Hyphomicrobium sp.]|nr:8-amino-7-oxononanoate synthase [Hyphomicrobium sp.]
MPATHDRALDALTRRGRLRALEPRRGIDFASNDYLGLAHAPALRDAVRDALDRGVAPGSGGSRLLRGNDPEHEALEAEAAQFFRAETALFFGGGFTANTAIFSTLPARGDLIVYDELIHASAHDGMRLSKTNSVAARHNDPDSFADAIKVWRACGGTGTAWIAVESLYSMDGDMAPLDDLVAIADSNDGVLIVDEAHATGVYGDGRGLGAHLEGRANVISLHTCGKALGVMGALVLAPHSTRNFLVNRARPFIYATAPSPLMAATVRAALRLIESEPQRRTDLKNRVALVSQLLAKHGRQAPSGSHIQPIIVGSDTAALTLAQSLQDRGFDIRAIRPPTVPEGTSRLRLSLTLNASDDETRALLAALAELEART